MMDSNDSSLKVSQKLLTILYAGGIVIVVVSWLLMQFMIPFLGIDLGRMSFFAGGRIYLLIFFSLFVLPLSIFGEWWLSLWRKRKFLWKSAAAIIGAFGLFVLVSILFLTVFDVLLSGLAWIWQMPLFIFSYLSGMLAIALVFRNQRVKKWRKNFGW